MKVIVKRLYRDVDVGIEVDLLIKEVDYMVNI